MDQLEGGVSALIQWGINFVLTVGVAGCSLYFLYAMARRGVAHKQEEYEWEKKRNTALVCGVGVIVGIVVFNGVMSFFR